MACEVAHIINPSVKELIKHLPAVAALGDRAECGEVYQYLQLAKDKGFNKEDLAKIAECVDFEAYFLRFMNGRGIMDTILAVDNLDKRVRSSSPVAVRPWRSRSSREAPDVDSRGFG